MFAKPSLTNRQSQEITLLLEYTDRSQLREWLMANHATAKECWVTMYRTKTPRTPDFGVAAPKINLD